MPIFEYVCKDCGAEMEVLHLDHGELSVTTCKTCGSSNLRKKISAPYISLQGKNPSNGKTCCGRSERCDTPPCETSKGCAYS